MAAEENKVDMKVLGWGMQFLYKQQKSARQQFMNPILELELPTTGYFESSKEEVLEFLKNHDMHTRKKFDIYHGSVPGMK